MPDIIGVMKTPTEALYAHIGHEIRRHREHRDITQTELADAVGLTRTVVADIEHGRQQLPVHRLIMFAQAFGLSFTELVSGPVPGYVQPIPEDKSRLRTILEIARDQLDNAIKELQ